MCLVTPPNKSHLIANTLGKVIQRPDELTEFLSIYWKEGKASLPNQVKKGLGNALRKFDEYQLAKYNRTQKEVKLCDVLNLCHPKPDNSEQADLWGRLLQGTLETPDTWETKLSAGADKKDTFTRLILGPCCGTSEI
jgi:hypothetical protein